MRVMNDSDILTDLSPPALVAAIQENEVAWWVYRARAAGWELREEPGLTWYRSGLANPMDNGVLRTDLAGDEADARIEATIAGFMERGLSMVWWGGPARRPADLGARLVARGFEFEGDDPGMAADLRALNEGLPAPLGLAIERVTDDEGTYAWVDVLGAKHAGRRPPSRRSPLDLQLNAPASYAPDDPYRLYLARLDGVPVATASVLLGAGVAGVYCVATVPEARRKGIGAAVVLAGLREAREAGYRVGVLGSTAMGFNVYRRLGFVQYCLLQSYILRP